MAPNLLVLMLSCFPSKRWIEDSDEPSRSSSTARSDNATGPNKTPVPGIYKRGKHNTWYLTAVHNPATGRKTKLFEPREVAYCKLLHRWMFVDEIESRTLWGNLPANAAKTGTKAGPVGFFQLDDGTTWVNHLNANGLFINAAGHARFCLVDREKAIFRPMLRGDDPIWCASKRATPRAGLSRPESSHATSGTMTADGNANEKSYEKIDAEELSHQLEKLEYSDQTITNEPEQNTRSVK